MYKVQTGRGDDDDDDDREPAPPLSAAEAAEALGAIRQYMDRSAKFSHYTAISGFIAGAATLIGCAVLVARHGLNPAPGWEFGAVWSAVASPE